MRKVLMAACVGLAACGPVSVTSAEDSCVEDARLAKSPRGVIGVGVSSDGPKARGGIVVSSDFLLGRDPEEVYNACVVRKSGQSPSRPLTAHPRWDG